MQAFVENFLQALVAGILIGSIYGLMCVGLGLIFGVMRVINFAQGEFLMLGMYATLYIVTGLGVAAVLGPYARAVHRRRARRSACSFVGGYLLHRYLVSRVTGVRAIGAEGEGHYAQLILTLGVCAGAAERRPDSVRLDAAVGAHAAVGQRLGSRRCRSARRAVFVNKARTCRALISRRRDRSLVLVHQPLAARQSAARRRRQSRSGYCTWASTSTARIGSRSASAPA